MNTRLNIGHKNGGKITAIVAIAHSTYKKRTEWHFVGTCEWADGSHSARPGRHHDINPVMLCLPDGGHTEDLERALAALNEYLRKHGEWKANGWVPHEPQGREEVTL